MVLILQQILPKYRYEVLKYLDENHFRILYSNVLKENSISSYNTNDVKFVEIPILRIGEKYYQSVIVQLFKFKPNIIVYTPELRNFTFWLLILLKLFFKYKLIAWTHGINNVDFVEGKLATASKIRLFMMKCSDGVIAYSEDRANLLKSYLGKKILVANNTLDTKSLNVAYNEVSQKSRNEVCKFLDIPKECRHFIYVGRLIKEKQIENSLKLFNKIRKEIECQFHIVGEGPHREALEEYINVECINDVTFQGKITDPLNLGYWLYVSDLHFHLGYVGLAVVHSLCFETPIVTLKPKPGIGPYHSPEYIYLNEKNSIIVDGIELKEKVLKVLLSYKRINSMRKQCRDDFLNNCALDNFIETFLNIEENF